MKYIITAVLAVAAALTAAFVHCGRRIKDAEWRIEDEEGGQQSESI